MTHGNNTTLAQLADLEAAYDRRLRADSEADDLEMDLASARLDLEACKRDIENLTRALAVQTRASERLARAVCEAFGRDADVLVDEAGTRLWQTIHRKVMVGVQREMPR